MNEGPGFRSGGGTLPRLLQYPLSGTGAGETRLLGIAAASLAIPLLAFFAWQDRAVEGIPEFLPARIASLALFIVSGLTLWNRAREDRIVYLVHGAALLGLLAMNCYLIYVVLSLYPGIEGHRTLALNALTVDMFAVFLFAGGLRRLVPLILGLPLLVLVVVLYAEGALGPAGFAWFSNPVVLVVLLSGLSFLQEGSSRREAEAEALSALRLNQLEAFLDAITETALLLDPEGRVVFANLTTAQRLGRPLAEIKGGIIWDFLPPSVGGLRRRLVEEVFRSGRAQRFEDRNGELFFDQVIYPVRDGGGKVAFVAVFGKDVSCSRMREESLVRQALHDPLTGLSNRRALQDRLGQALSRAARGYPSSFLYLDLDHFKDINDQCGHGVGDEVLVAVARLIAEGERDFDAVFRLGGDEFAVLLEGAGLDEALGVAERIRSRVDAEGFSAAAACKAPLGLSIGCVEVSGQASVDAVIRQADAAMYRAKLEGRDRVKEG